MSSTSQCSELFLGSIADRDPCAADTLEPLLATKLEAARAAWPDVAIEDADLVPYLAAHLGPGGDIVTALDALNVTDLYLACGCALGLPSALAAFESAMFRDVDSTIASMRAPSALADDIKQWLRQRLFVRSDDVSAPRIAEYAGTGELRTWFRVIAMRAIISELRKTRREVAVSDNAFDGLQAPAAEAELSLFRQRYQADFKVAFEEAVEALEPRQRNLLRQQLVDGLSVDEIAAIYRAHRVTIARWLAKARKDVWSLTRKALADRLKISPSELEAALREIRSQLDLSLSRVLKSSSPGSL